jgi:hypothetical protein
MKPTRKPLRAIAWVVLAIFAVAGGGLDDGPIALVLPDGVHRNLRVRLRLRKRMAR